jgi:hypothetical protein
MGSEGIKPLSFSGWWWFARTRPRNFLSCPWYIMLSFLSCFSHKGNGCDDLISKTYRPVDTIFPRLLIWGMLSMNIDQSWDKPLCYKRVSLFGDCQCENLLVFWLGSPKIADTPGTNLEQCFIKYKPKNIFSWGYPIRLVLLNPVPDENVVSIDKAGVAFPSPLMTNRKSTNTNHNQYAMKALCCSCCKCRKWESSIYGIIVELTGNVS